jgi:hypothetical protein
MRRRIASRTKRAASRPRGHQCKARSPRGLPIGLTLYFYPRTRRLTPALYDPELERLVRRGLAKAREHLARRGSAVILKCVLVTLPHGEAFWLGEGN